MSRIARRWTWSEPVSRLMEAMDEGAILGFPTESSYALGADPLDPRGVGSIYQIKGRSGNKPLPVVLGDLEQLGSLGGDSDDPVLCEIASLWPAPLTVVVPIAEPLPATAGISSLAIRIPAHENLRSLLQEMKTPLTATSANLSGGEPVSRPEMLELILASWPSLVVDDGVLPGGTPSTIVSLSTDSVMVVRQGAYPVERIAEAVSIPVFSAAAEENSVDLSWRAR